MRTLMSRILLVCCLALAAAGPGTASAQTADPFGGLPPAQTDTSTVATTSTSTTTDGGLKRWQETLIFLAGVALLSGIAYAIVSDARKVAPVTEEERSGAHPTSPGSARKAHDKAKARQKAKRARAARKKNR
jgi:hypothetical protein